MNIEQIQELVKDFISDNGYSTEQCKSKASAIKRTYNIFISNKKKSNQEILIDDLKKIYLPLLSNYENIKNFNSINQVLQSIAEEMTDSNINNGNSDFLTREIIKIHTDILGNPGTTSKDMSSEYISAIISRKIANADGLNRDDIINLLDMQSLNMYMDVNQYQKLINDSLLTYIDNFPECKEEITNPKIFNIFESLISSYRYSGDFEKIQQLCQKSLEFKKLENSEAYKNMQELYKKVSDYIEMKKSFSSQKFNSLQELLDMLKTTYIPDLIFGGKPSGSQHTSNPPTIHPANTPDFPTKSIYSMPTDKKLEAISKLCDSLKEDNPNHDILECELGKDRYNGYVIFHINNSGVSIFENFSDKNARFYIVEDELIEQIIPLSRSEANKTEGVSSANHIENFEQYCKNITDRTKETIHTQLLKKIQREKEFGKGLDSSIQQKLIDATKKDSQNTKE